MKSTRFSVAPFFATSNISKLCATTLLACSSYSFSSSVLADEHHVHNVPEAAHTNAAQGRSQQAENQTLALTKTMADYRKAKPEDKAKHLGQMITLAKERQTMLAELAQTNPAAAVRAVLPAAVRKGMPEDVQDLLEQEQELEGELEVFYEDYEDHSKSRLRHVLKTKNGHVELHVPGNAKAHTMQSGMKVRAKGWQFKDSSESLDSLALNNEKDNLIILADGSTTTTSTASTTTAALSNTLGEQRTLVMLVNFQDNAQQPWTVDQVQEMVFGTVNDYYKEASFGQTWLSGDVKGYYTLPINAICDTAEIYAAASQVAEANGLDTSSYSRLLYVFPKIDNCGWAGKGTVGGNPSKAWINGELTLRAVGHELGHNLGLHHAKKLECDVGVISGDCYTIEYGDSLDIMGSPGFTGHFNAFNKDLLGWLSSETSTESGQITEVQTDGSYLLEPYESTPSGAAKVLKVQRGIDATTGEKLWYYLEYRQPLGFDSYLSKYPAITSGISFHLGTESDSRSSQLIDMTPASAIADWNDAALSVGSSYTDPDAGVTITTEWADSTGASVHVSFSEQACAPSNPVIALVPNESAGVEAGTTVSYNATVTNQDSSSCAASDFNVSANVPAGWAATGSTLNLAPGETSTVTLNVTSADTATDGNYDIAISAENSSDSSYHSSSVASYVVETPVAACELGNPRLSLTANQTGEVAPGTTVSYTATVTSQDSSSCDAAVVDVVASVPAGWSADSGTVTLAPGATASVNLNVTSADDAAEGAYPIDVNAFNTADISYNSSAVGSYNVAAPVCEAAAPLLSVSAPTGEVVAGSTVNYSATVTNRDSSDCTAADFAVSADVPAGWSAGSTNVNLAPGESTTVNISVTSAATASDGVYNITINMQNMGDTQFSNSDTVSYTITTPVNNTPVAVNDAVTLPAKEAILIDVLANDSDPDGGSLSISSVTQGAKGSVQITSDGQLIYTPAKSFKSSDSFSYTISDGEKTSTATVSISLASTDGGNKGKGNNK